MGIMWAQKQSPAELPALSGQNSVVGVFGPSGEIPKLEAELNASTEIHSQANVIW